MNVSPVFDTTTALMKTLALGLEGLGWKSGDAPATNLGNLSNDIANAEFVTKALMLRLMNPAAPRFDDAHTYFLVELFGQSENWVNNISIALRVHDRNDIVAMLGETFAEFCDSDFFTLVFKLQEAVSTESVLATFNQWQPKFITSAYD